jgi:hypothetical protein
LAEYGDAFLLQALINYCKIHQTKKMKKATDKDSAIQEFINIGNNLQQTPLMFAAYHGRSEVVTFLLRQVRREVHWLPSITLPHPSYSVFVWSLWCFLMVPSGL